MDERTFATFFHGWLVRQEQLLQKLLQIQSSLDENDDEHREEEGDESGLLELVSRVMTHYEEYYDAKARVTRHNVFRVFSAPWLTSYERLLLWIAGFKPGLAFRVVTNSGLALTAEQRRRMEALEEEIRSEERELSERLLRIQEAASAPQTLALARRGGRETNGIVDDGAEAVIEGVTAALEGLVAAADRLRKKTVLQLMEILSAVQTVRFLTAVAELQLRIRRWGVERDAAMRGAGL